MHVAMDAPTLPQEDAIPAALKAEFEEWGTKTTGGVLAGMLYGGVREAASAAKTEQSRLPFPHEDKKPRGKIIREMTENKVLRIARGTVLGGAKLGAFVALFSGIQHGLAVHRGNHDALNTVAAGGVTGGTFSLTLPGSLLTRISSAAVGTLLGGFLALPLGLLQSNLEAELKPVQEQEAREPQLIDGGIQQLKYKEGVGVDAVIRRLESRAPEPALRSQE
ncbi:uncharacterized protein [Physcomitrium patens]|uniref:Complex I assembly factor TIMMDC1, mitochondrial n=3 Tax=Physcomitrium patens TaxID=3218 RepID=A0A2K1J4C3_PHYPA|nr:complex I assembly factor TIMMDC1, mitochondrial-like [Physcomitrium patens]PNR36373.1 hypothetical protein PHYPA_022224 [Physcomitrium patens]|eukprot:XP_024400157.1 complex I assembly factor TIMMDC1, mitochondrial-like [Physcomitrella patens]